MTEETAKTKWCPQVTVLHRKSIILDGHEHDFPSNINCRASECMMWRWEGSKHGDDGYCGLAGKCV